MIFTDSRMHGGPGFWPMQHEFKRQGYDLDARMCWIGGRILTRDTADGELGHYKYDGESVGDITGGLLYKKDGDKRPIPGWRLSPWPVVVTKPKNPSQARADPGYQATVPVFHDEEKAKRDGTALSPDERFLEIDPTKPSVKGVEIWPRFPLDWRGIMVPATNEDKQIETFLPTDPRVCVPQKAGDPKTGSFFVDLNTENEVDQERVAQSQSYFRVIKHPKSERVKFKEKVSVLAWSICPSALDAVGWGLVFDRAEAADDKATQDLPLFARQDPAPVSDVPNYYVSAPLAPPVGEINQNTH